MSKIYLFESVRTNPSVKCVVNITMDKGYENRGWLSYYSENETKGELVPYSIVKLVQS